MKLKTKEQRDFWKAVYVAQVRWTPDAAQCTQLADAALKALRKRTQHAPEKEQEWLVNVHKIKGVEKTVIANFTQRAKNAKQAVNRWMRSTVMSSYDEFQVVARLDPQNRVHKFTVNGSGKIKKMRKERS